MSAISAVSGNNSASSASNSTLTPKTLNQNDFLNLLCTQMQHQDPLNPQSNTDFIAQMAQFTALQTATQTQTSMANMQANSLLGQSVLIKDPSGNTAGGTVSGIDLSTGTPQVVVNGAEYALSSIIFVMPTTPSATQPTTTVTPATQTSSN